MNHSFIRPFYVTTSNTWGQAFYRSQKLTSRNKKAWVLVLRMFKRERENWSSPGHLVEPQYAVDPWCLLFDILPFYKLAPYYWDRSKALMSSAYLWVITPLSRWVASAIILTITIAIRRSPAYLHLQKCSSFFTTWPGWKSFKFLNSVSLWIVNSTWLSFLFYEFEICS